jgi:hypothetical protein
MSPWQNAVDGSAFQFLVVGTGHALTLVSNRPKLPKREPEWSDQGALTVAPSADAPPISAVLLAPTEDQVWLEERTRASTRGIWLGAQNSKPPTRAPCCRWLLRQDQPQPR